MYYKAIEIKTAWYWNKNRHIDQWNKIESQEINPSLHGQFIFEETEETKTYNGLKIIYSVSGVEKIGLMACIKMNLDLLLWPHTRINSKWIKDLSVRLKTIKILEENKAVKSQTLLIIIFYLIYLLRQGKQKKKNKQMGLYQTKKFLHSKGNHHRNGKTTRWMRGHISWSIGYGVNIQNL